MADYEALGTRLRLPGAVVVLPLTPAQVDSYLTQVGQPMAAVRAALQEDPTLRELLDTPLMLNIVTVAYRGEPLRALPMHAPPEVQRHHIFAAYVDGMFKRRSTIAQYTRQQTERWLTWLARAMKDHSQTVFYLEQMQPAWLPGPKLNWRPSSGQRRLVTFITSIMSALLVGLGGPVYWLLSGLPNGLNGGLIVLLINGMLGGVSVGIESWLIGGLVYGLSCALVFGLAAGLDGGLQEGLLDGLVFGLLGGSLGGLSVWLVGYSKEIKPVEKLRWSWSEARSAWRHRRYERLVGGLIFVLVGGLVGMLSSWLLGKLHWMVFMLLVRGVYKLLSGGLVEKLRWSWSEARSAWKLRQYERFGAWLVFGLVGWLLVGLDYELIFWLAGGLVFGLLVRLVFGLLGGFTVGEIETKSSPNEGIKRSVQNASIGGLSFGLVLGLGFGLLIGWRGGLVKGFQAGLSFGLVLGPLVGLRFGGRACLQHFALRLVLWHSNFAPFNYIRFLDYAAARIFLRKVGGGYVFVHRMLLEYFAAMNQTSAEQQK